VATDNETMERRTLEHAESLRQEFSKRDKLYRLIDAILFGDVEIKIPEAYCDTALAVHAPMALNIASTVTAALSVNPMSINFKPIGFGDIYQQNSTLRENFFEASWRRQEQEARRQLLRLFIWSVVTKGEGVLKTVERSHTVWGQYSKLQKRLEDELASDRDLDDDAKDRVYQAKTEEAKLALPYPITTTDCPPETFYYTKNEHGLTSAVECKELPYHEALARFGMGLSSYGDVVKVDEQFDPRALGLPRAEWSRVMGDAGQQTIRCIEAWDPKVQVIILQGPGQRGRIDRGTLAKVVPHSYGDEHLGVLRGPYFHALGTTTDSRLPEHAGLSVLFGYLELFPLLDSLLTMQANSAYMTGFAAFKRTTPPGQIPGLPQPPYGTTGQETQPERIVPGQLYPYDVSPIDQPRAGADMDKFLQNVQALLERALPSTVQGVVASDTSGYALNQAAYLARLNWNPIVSNVEVALGERTGFESWLIQHRIGEKVYAWGEVEARRDRKRISGQSKAAWLGIGPDDLKGVHRYEARLEPSTPSNEIIATRAIGEKMQLRLITYEDAVGQAGSNPDEVEKSWLLHELKNSQEVQAELKAAIFSQVATIRARKIQATGIPVTELAGITPPGAGGPPIVPGATGVPGGTPGVGNPGQLGGMPPQPVPSPGMGLPIAPPPPPGSAGGTMLPGGIPGGPVVPGPPANYVGP
jgi:hypothetical protein